MQIIKKLPLYVFTDLSAPGDDGIALHHLLAYQEQFDIHALVACSGNMWAEDVASNLENLLGEANCPDITVYLPVTSQYHSKRKEIFEEYEKNCWWNGDFCGALASEIPVKQKNTTYGSMSELTEAIRSDSGKVVILSLAPLTVLSQLLHFNMDLINKVRQVFIFGGVLSAPGNVTENAEFNFWFDPDAAQAVLNSGLPIKLLPLDTLKDIVYPEDINFESGNLYHDYISRYLYHNYSQRTGNFPIHIYDEALACVLIDPDLVLNVDSRYVSVVTKVSPMYGKLREIENKSTSPVHIIRQVNSELLLQRILIGT